MSLNRNHKIILAVVAAITVVLIIIGISSCSPSKESVAGDFSGGAAASCVPPLACGPHYASYVPPYYLAHPSYALMTPYSALYAPSFNGRSYSVARTPAGRAPVAARKPLPYPPGYKPVPGDFQPPTARGNVPSVPSPAAKIPEPVKKQFKTPKFSTPKFKAPRLGRRK